jgi:hypothetical protein
MDPIWVKKINTDIGQIKYSTSLIMFLNLFCDLILIKMYVDSNYEYIKFLKSM